jgi:hypothetical protein
MTIMVNTEAPSIETRLVVVPERLFIGSEICYKRGRPILTDEVHYRAGGLRVI